MACRPRSASTCSIDRQRCRGMPARGQFCDHDPRCSRRRPTSGGRTHGTAREGRPRGPSRPRGPAQGTTGKIDRVLVLDPAVRLADHVPLGPVEVDRPPFSVGGPCTPSAAWAAEIPAASNRTRHRLSFAEAENSLANNATASGLREPRTAADSRSSLRSHRESRARRCRTMLSKAGTAEEGASGRSGRRGYARGEVSRRSSDLHDVARVKRTLMPDDRAIAAQSGARGNGDLWSRRKRRRRSASSRRAARFMREHAGELFAASLAAITAAKC